MTQTYEDLMAGRVGGCYRCAEQGHPCHVSYHLAWDEAQAMERERCARVAEDFNEGYSHTGRDIAKLIRRVE